MLRHCGPGRHCATRLKAGHGQGCEGDFGTEAVGPTPRRRLDGRVKRQVGVGAILRKETVCPKSEHVTLRQKNKPQSSLSSLREVGVRFSPLCSAVCSVANIPMS